MLRALTVEVVRAFWESREIGVPQIVTGERDEEFGLGKSVETVVDQFRESVKHGFVSKRVYSRPLNSSMSKDTGFKLLKSEVGVFIRASVTAPKVQLPCLLGWYGQYLHE